MKQKEHYPLLLLITYIFFWLILAIKPYSYIIWFAESSLAIIAILGLIITYKKFRFSDLSYTFIFIFLLLHTIGSHYSYSEVPLFNMLKESFDLPRNYFDRAMHFLAGLLLYFPLYELVAKKLCIKKFWKYFIPFMIITAGQAIYEVIEYLAFAVTQSDFIRINFLGLQGDNWDAQKDTIWEILGAGISWLFMWIKEKR